MSSFAGANYTVVISDNTASALAELAQAAERFRCLNRFLNAMDAVEDQPNLLRFLSQCVTTIAVESCLVETSTAA